MNYKAGFLAVVFLIATLCYLPGGAAADAAPADASYRFQLATNNQDSVFQDMYDNKDYAFQLMSYWNTKRVTVRLDYKITQIADPKRSVINVSLNGQPFYSFHPQASQDAGTISHISVDIPARLIKQGGINRLSINSEMNENDSDRICRTDSTDHWLTIYKTSYVRADYQNKTANDRIDNFFNHFSGVDTMTGQANAVAVSDQESATELSAAARSLAGLNKVSAYAPDSANRGVALERWGSTLVANKRWVVLISEYDHLPEKIKGAIPASKVDQAALIKIIRVDGKQVAVVTSKNHSLLTKAAQCIANPSLLKQMKTSETYIDKQTDVQTASTLNTAVNQKFVASSDQVTGPFHHDKTYYFSIPLNQVLAAGSKIHLQLRYAENLNFDRSLVTVSVNDVPIGSHRLSQSHANADSVDVTIPKDIDVSGNFSVKVSYDLEMDGLKCARPGSKSPWALITPQSYMSIYTKDVSRLLFQSYPYPFLANGQFNHIAVVLPDHKDSDVYAALSHTFSLIGKYAQSNGGDVVFYDQHVDRKKLAGKNLIVLGSYKDNALIRELNSHLFIKYNKNGSGFTGNEKIKLNEQYGETIGTIQLITSPFSQENGALVITAAQADDMARTSAKLARERDLYSISGDGLYMDRDRHIQANRYKKAAGDEQGAGSLFDNVKRNPETMWFILLAAFMFLTILVTLLLLYLKYRKGGDSRHEEK